MSFCSPREKSSSAQPAARSRKNPPADCDDSRRILRSICVVERAVDILSVEKSNTFRGKFHVLVEKFPARRRRAGGFADC